MSAQAVRFRRVGIIIVHYSGYLDTRRCLASLARLRHGDHFVVLVDNASSDRGAQQAAVEFPEIRILQMGRNLGFAGGVNRGIAYAVEHGATHLLLLNNDAEITDPTFVDDSCRVLDAHPEIGLVAPRVLDGFSGREQNTILAPVHRSITARVRWRLCRARARNTSPTADTTAAAALSGVCWMLRTDVTLTIGLLDEAFFMYAEDNDYCHRLFEAGFRVARLERIAVSHFQKSTIPTKLSALRNQMQPVNDLYLLRKHGCSRPYQLLKLLLWTARSARRLLMARPGDWAAEWEAFGRVMKGMLRVVALRGPAQAPVMLPK